MPDTFEFTFLGTGDASGYPHPFCNCENCVEAREIGGKSFRLRSHALINNELLIDLSPDLLSSSFLQRKPLHDIRYVLQTHPHVDHLEPAQLAMRSERFGIMGLPDLEFFGTRASTDRIRKLLSEHKSLAQHSETELLNKLKLTLTDIEAHQTFAIGPYEITAVPASHDAPGVCLLFAIRLGDICIFYGNDTGPLSDAVWPTLKAAGITFDMVILDHTFGVRQGDAGHMSGAMVVETISRMRDEQLLKPGVRIFGNHIAPHSNPVHEKLVRIVAESGYEAAYDGLTVTFG